MKIIETISEMKIFRKNLSGTVGFVPTMGALHEGHVSLVQESILGNSTTIVSIFVNPTQFNNPDDFKNYPNTLSEDIKVLQDQGVNVLFLPKYEELYADQYRFKVSESKLSQILCGKIRPGHFDGVLTVVMKLFNITSPNQVYFGEKDYQQLILIKEMISTFFMDIKLNPVKTKRYENGLAMSSRNSRLTPEQLEKAPLIYSIMRFEPDIQIAKTQLKNVGFEVDYLEDVGNRRFIAAYLGKVRLIDNIEKEFSNKSEVSL